MSAETLPDIYLELPNSSWPPASDVTPSGTAEVTSWRTDREIVSQTLPGQVRAGSGLSIGDATVTIRQSSGKPMAPWGRGDRKVSTGGRANLYGSHAGPSSDDRLSLGPWMVDPIQGSILSPEVPIELIEAQYVGRTQPNLLPTNDADFCDPAWVVSVLAAQAGFHAVPPPVTSSVFAVSASGSLWPERGLIDSYFSPPSWDRSTGPMSPVGGFDVQFVPASNFLTTEGASWFVTLNVVGTATFNLGNPSHTQRPAIQLRPNGVVAARVKESSAWQTATYAPGLDPEHPMRVQVEIQRTGSSGSWTSFRARARSADDATWSAWATSTASSNHAVANWFQITVPAGSSISGMQITTGADPNLWLTPSADIDPLGGRMVSPWLPGDMDAWTGIQQVCGAYCGAAWLTNQRMMTVRNRDYMGGGDTHRDVIDVEATAEDVGWSVDPDDTADRLVVTFNPADIERYQSGAFGPVVWEAPDVLELAPGQSIEVVAELPFYANLITSWLPVWDLAADTASSWSAFPNREGSGTHAADDSLVVTVRPVSTGRAIITVQNTTATTLYTVDAAGNPCLILRGYKIARQENQATVTRGVSESASANELAVDLGRYVQTVADAEALADFLWARVSTPMWKADAVNVRLDWSRDIGRIIRLEHPLTDLSVKALVVGIHMTGSDGVATQALDLVLLPPTWFDFDQAWAGKTWADFDSVWADGNWAAFDAEPLTNS